MPLVLHEHGDDAPLHLQRIFMRLIEDFSVQLQFIHEGVNLFIDLAVLLVVLGE